MVNMSDCEWNPGMDDDKKHRRTSSVWRYCEMLDSSYARCTICDHKLSYKSSVTNLRKHFSKKHPDVVMTPNTRYVPNRPRRDSSDDEDRGENQRAVNSVIVDYLRPAGEENRPKFSSCSDRNSGNMYKYSQSMKRERSPDRHDVRMSSKYRRREEVEESEFELFGRSVTMQLKNLPLVHALELQAEITNAIIQKRIQALRQSNETSTDEPMQYALVYATTSEAPQNCEEIPSVENKDPSTESNSEANSIVISS